MIDEVVGGEGLCDDMLPSFSHVMCNYVASQDGRMSAWLY